MYLLYRLGLINNRVVKVILKDCCVAFTELDRFGRVINAYYDGLISGIHCLSNDFYVDFMGLRFRDVFRSMVEVFVEGQWGFLDVRDRQVIDVGAFNGDSAIYFVTRGASRVIAVEPHPKAYMEMLKNLELNNLLGRVIPVNVALGKGDYVELPVDVSLDYVIDKIYEGLFNRRSMTVKIRSITLGELLNLTGAEPDVLKLDCEGCEYDIIEHDYETLRLFRELGIECHPYLRGKELGDCLKILSRDFRCSVVNNLKSRAIIHCIRD
jgi:FkbM family methyltransferase